MPYYLGIDAGGSKTNALLVDERGFEVGRGRTGNGNHQLDRDVAERNIRRAVEQALTSAGIAKAEVAFACFGLSGADREADYRVLRPLVAAIGLPAYRICCDTMVALRAGSDRPHGIVLICGTGTNCAGRGRDGRELQIGGFGYLYGDFGGGADLANEAFRAVVREWEGRGPATALTAMMLARYGYSDVETMVNEFLDRNVSRVPLSIVPDLFAAADGGDAVATALLTRQGEELGLTARAMIVRLGLEGDRFDVVLAGSVAVKGTGEYITGPVMKAVRQVAPAANVCKLETEPAVGAVLLAMDAAGIEAKTARDRLARLILS